MWIQQRKESVEQKERVALTYVHYCVKHIISGKLLYNTELSLMPLMRRPDR